MSNLVKRSDKLAFFGVSSNGETVYTRMSGFTNMSINKNPKEYTRQYIDEEFEQADVVGYSPTIAYSLDLYSDNSVHNDILNIGDKELTGSDAIREIVLVNTASQNTLGEFDAVKREFSVVPDSEGSGTDAYQLSGSFKVKGPKVFGKATSQDGWQTCTFVPNED